MIIRIYRKNNLYYIAFMIWFVSDCLSGTMIKNIAGISLSKVDDIVNVLVLLFLMFKIFFKQQYSFRQIVFITFCTVPMVFSAIASANLNVLCLWIFLVAAKDIDINRLVKDVYFALVVLIILVCTLCLAGVIDDFTMYRDGIRHSLGFGHPNALGMRLFQFVVCFLIIHNGKMLLQMAVTFAVCLFTYLVPNSQTPSILMAIILLLLPFYYFAINSKKRARFFIKAMMAGTFFSAMLSFIFTFIDISRYKLLKTFNELLSFRFTWTYRAFSESGIKLFGQIVRISEEERRVVGLKGHLYLDNAYATLLIRYGFAVSVIFLVMYIRTMHIQKKQGNLMVLLIYFVYSLYGIMESSMFKLTYNIVLLYIAGTLYRDDNSNMNIVDKGLVLCFRKLKDLKAAVR